MTASYIATDLVDGVLLPLRVLLERLRIPRIAFWVFRDARLHVLSADEMPFGMRPPEFERRTREPSGFRVTAEEFDGFLRVAVQFVDGTIQAFPVTDPSRCALLIECEDASQWVISTDSLEVEFALQNSGFERRTEL